MSEWTDEYSANGIADPEWGERIFGWSEKERKVSEAIKDMIDGSFV